MAVYKIFAEKDASLYSEANLANTGLDAILDLSKSPSLLHISESAAARPVIKFLQSDIVNTVNNYIGSRPYSAFLKLYLATATGISTNFYVEARPLAEYWDMGIGHYGETPVNATGASWTYKLAKSTGAWSTGSLGVTSSYTATNPGGGSWYTGSAVTQSFTPYATQDINLDVSSFIYAYKTGSLVNNGFILKNNDSVEFNKNYAYTLQYFSRDTNTIYPPVLEFKWDDSDYSPSSQNNICLNGNINLSLQNNKLSFNEESIVKLRISVREKYPVRVFSTGSLYTTQKYLPSSSYYSIVDYKTDDVVVDFDNNYTKISADSQSNYLTLHMSGLEPARYYKLLIKTIIGSEVLVFDENLTFKID